MAEYIKKVAEVIKQRIQSNLDQIHQNEEKIKKILKEPVTSDRTSRLEKQFKINKELINENNFAIKLQKELIAYMEVLQIGNFLPQEQIEPLESNKFDSDHVKGSEKLKRKDYFELTISNNIEFDARHPYYDDPEFLNALLEYYISIEDYETCASLKQIMQS
jgi:hypothetical protein